MAGRRLDELFFDITARTDGLTRGLAVAQRDMSKFRGLMVGPAGVVAGLTAFGAAAVAAGIKATRMAASLDSAFREVSTLLPGTVESMASLRRELVELSTEVPQTPELLSRGLYQVLSSGVSDTADAMDVLTVAAKAAVAGLTDTFTAADVLTTVLNAYQLEAGDAARVSDVLFRTVDKGKIEFSDLASDIGGVVTSAALAGVSIEEVGAALATMTLFGVQSAEATTSLNRLLISLTQVTDDQAAAAERLGVEFSLAALQSKGLVGFLQDLEQATGGNLELLSELNPNIRSARAAFILAGQGASRYGEILSEMNSSAGATERAFTKINGSLDNQAQILKNQVNAAWLSFGNVILPLVLSSLENLNRLLESDTETAIRLLQSLGNERAAAVLRAQEDERALAEAVEDGTRRIEASLRERRRAVTLGFREARPDVRGPLGEAGEFAPLRGVVDPLRVLPDLIGKSTEEQEELLAAARSYAEEVRRSEELTGAQHRALADVELLNARILSLIRQQVALQAAGEPAPAAQQALESEIDALRERASILSQAGEAEAENVRQIRRAMALRENELDLLRAREDLAEKQARAPASSLEDAQRRIVGLTRAAADATEEGRDAILAQLRATQDTQAALQRVNDLETVRANIGRETTAEYRAQSEAIVELQTRLAELNALLSDPGELFAQLDLERQIEQAEEMLALIREGARIAREGVTLESPEADFEAFELEGRLLQAQRAIEKVTRSTASFGQQALAVQGILDLWGVTVDQLPAGFQAVVRAMLDVEGAATDTEKSLQAIIQDVSFAARGAVELASAFGLVGDEASAAVSQIALIAEGIGRIAAGDIAGGIGGVLSGLAGLLASGGESETTRELRIAMEDNARRVRELTQRIDLLSGVIRGIPGGIQDAFLDAFRSVDFGAAGVDDFDALLAAFEREGLSLVELRQLAERAGIDADLLLEALERRARGEPLPPALVDEAVLDQAQRLFDALDRGLADVLDTVRGRLDLLRTSFDVLDIEDPAEQLRLLAEELGKAGTALTPAEIQRLAEGDEAFIEELFRQLQAGTGRFTDIGAFGALSFDEFLDILREMEGIQDRIADGVEAGEEGDFQQVAAINRLTVEQGDTLIALAGSRNFFLEEIRNSLRGGVAPVQVTDSMLAAAGTVRVEGTITHDVNVRDAAGLSPEAAAALGEAMGGAMIDRDLGSELRRIRAGFGLPPVRTQ